MFSAWLFSIVNSEKNDLDIAPLAQYLKVSHVVSSGETGRGSYTEENVQYSDMILILKMITYYVDIEAPKKYTKYQTEHKKRIKAL